MTVPIQPCPFRDRTPPAWRKRWEIIVETRLGQHKRRYSLDRATLRRLVDDPTWLGQLQIYLRQEARSGYQFSRLGAVWRDKLYFCTEDHTGVTWPIVNGTWGTLWQAALAEDEMYRLFLP